MRKQSEVWRNILIRALFRATGLSISRQILTAKELQISFVVGTSKLLTWKLKNLIKSIPLHATSSCILKPPTPVVSKLTYAAIHAPDPSSEDRDHTGTPQNRRMHTREGKCVKLRPCRDSTMDPWHRSGCTDQDCKTEPNRYFYPNWNQTDIILPLQSRTGANVKSTHIHTRSEPVQQWVKSFSLFYLFFINLLIWIFCDIYTICTNMGSPHGMICLSSPGPVNDQKILRTNHKRKLKGHSKEARIALLWADML